MPDARPTIVNDAAAFDALPVTERVLVTFTCESGTVFVRQTIFEIFETVPYTRR